MVGRCILVAAKSLWLCLLLEWSHKNLSPSDTILLDHYSIDRKKYKLEYAELIEIYGTV